MERQAIDWEKMFINYIIKNGSVSAYIKTSKFNTNWQTKPKETKDPEYPTRYWRRIAKLEDWHYLILRHTIKQ